MNVSLSVEETNELRKKVGLKLIPLTSNPVRQESAVRRAIADARKRLEEKEQLEYESKQKLVRAKELETRLQPQLADEQRLSVSTEEWLEMMKSMLESSNSNKKSTKLNKGGTEIPGKVVESSVKRPESDISVLHNSSEKSTANRLIGKPNNQNREIHELETSADPIDPETGRSNTINSAEPSAVVRPVFKPVFKPKKRKPGHRRTVIEPLKSTETVSYDELLEQNRKEAVDTAGIESAKHEAALQLARTLENNTDNTNNDKENNEKNEKNEKNENEMAKPEQFTRSPLNPRPLPDSAAVHSDFSDEESDGGIAGTIRHLKPYSTNTSHRREWLDALVTKREETQLRLKNLEKKHMNLPYNERVEILKLHTELAAKEQSVLDRELLKQYNPNISIEHFDANGAALTQKQAFKRLSTAFHKRRKPV